MHDEIGFDRNLKEKQDAFFIACDAVGLTVGVLSRRCGISASTLGSYRRRDCREPSIMGLSVFVRLVSALPDEHKHLASVLIEDTGCFIAHAESAAAAWLAIGEKACALGGKIMRYQHTGGHIDHREDADLRTDLVEIISEGHGMIGGAR